MNALPLAVGVEFFDGFLSTDIAVFEWVQKLHETAAATVLTPILTAFTYLGEAGALFLLIAFVMLLSREYRKTGLSVIAALLFMVILNNVVLKNMFARPRPFNLYDDSRLGIIRERYQWWAERYTFPDIVKRPKSLSFPSGHSSSAFCAAFAGTFGSKKAKIALPFFLLAVLVAFSRVYVEVHYFSDIVAGAFAGFIYGAMGTLLVLILWNLFGVLVDDFIEGIKAKLTGKKHNRRPVKP